MSKIADAFAHYMRTTNSIRREYGDKRPRAVIALELARKDVSEGRFKYRRPWRNYYSVTRNPENNGLAYVESPEAIGLRLVGAVAADFGRRCDAWDNSGRCKWITRPYGETFDMAQGLVWQMPGRKGESLFVAGYAQEDSEGYTIDFGRIFLEPRGDYAGNPRDLDAAIDAARHADSMAEKFAEEERGYQTAWQAGTLYAEKSDEVATLRGKIMAILKERRSARGAGNYPALCAALKDKVSDMLGALEECRADMRQLAKGEYGELWFYSRDARLQVAFCEGAELDKFPD